MGKYDLAMLKRALERWQIKLVIAETPEWRESCEQVIRHIQSRIIED